ncbi:hypothetical protein LPB140_07025 [Sphingorhabdus lutea]|uniref:Class II aldolase/adducin N-terminal domain-containing protein n=1 Tax=Sphingorhabdus lutea TaxID=1913578 RepID=A0A1L3JEV8_9SPHN|nr:hypothetical protein LPB140_07025 [Sphingorhabdus lutea]
MPAPESLNCIKDMVSDVEWELRCQLAATYRLCAKYGWTDLVFTHISVRLPDEENDKGEMEERFLINPYGLLFHEITASSLIKIDLQGNICQETPYFINPAGFTIHSAVHMARHDAACVIHVHTPYGIAVSVQNNGLRRYTQFAMQIIDDLAYHDYEGIALNLDEREQIIADLGDKNLLMLRNHGTLTIGQNCAIAFLRMYFLENACKTQILAQNGANDGGLCEHPPEMAATVSAQGAAAFHPGMGDNLIWPALIRDLRRTHAGFDQ